MPDQLSDQSASSADELLNEVDRQLRGAVAENAKLRDLCARAVEALRYEANPVCDEWDDWLASDEQRLGREDRS